MIGAHLSKPQIFFEFIKTQTSFRLSREKPVTKPLDEVEFPKGMNNFL